MNKNFWVILILIFSITSCNSFFQKNPQDFKRASLYGMIYDLSNQPVSHVQITMDKHRKISSDVNGRFCFSGTSKGNHIVTAKKENFEEIEMEFIFSNKTQILYIKMISYNQILELAEKYIEERKWPEVEEQFKRAENLKNDDPSLLYLKAVKNYRTSNFKETLTLLNKLIELNYKQAYVYLFLADIYEYKLKNNVKAKEYLLEYLKLKSDIDIEKRLNNLK